MGALDFDHKVEKLEHAIRESTDISPHNKELIFSLKRDVALEGGSLAWQQNLLSRLKIIGQTLEVDLDEATVDDLKTLIEAMARRRKGDRPVSEVTVLDYKKVLRRMMRWMYGDEKREMWTWIKTTEPKKNRKLPENLLTEEDVKRLIDHEKKPRLRAFISLLWETGARIGELMDLRVGSFQDHVHGLQVVVSGKTGARRLLLIESVPHINNWLHNHIQPDPDAPLWVKMRVDANNNGGEYGYERVTYEYLRRELQTAAERAGIKKPMNPHHFRHSRATYLANRFTEAQLCHWFGWVVGSKEPAKYVHMSGRDIDSAYARLHGIEEDTEKLESQLTPIKCPRCEAKNEPRSKFCQRCGMALSLESALEVEKVGMDAVSVLSRNQDTDLMEQLSWMSKLFRLAHDNPEIAERIQHMSTE